MPLTPGTTQTIDTVSGAQGVAASVRRVLIVAAKIAAGTLAVNTPTQVMDEADADAKCGKGSAAALMLRAAMKAARFYVNLFGGFNRVQMPQFWVSCTADIGGTAATYTITTTVSGTAAAGELVIEVAGRVITVNVAAGDAQNTITAAIAAKIQSMPSELPVSAAAATNVCTLTAKNTGVNGDDIRAPKVRKAPTNVSVVSAAAVAGVGSIDITPPLDAAVDKRYHSVVIENHASADITKLKTWLDARWAPAAKLFSFAHVGEIGSIATATTLATAGNYHNLIVHECEGLGILPSELAAAAAAEWESEGRLQLSFNGVEMPFTPPDSADVFTSTEVETALVNGLSPYLPNAALDRIKFVRLATTKTTENSVAFDREIDAKVPRTLAEVASLVDAAWKLKFQRAVRDDDTIDGVKSEVFSVLLACQKEGWLQNVEKYKNAITATKSGINALEVGYPVSVIPDLHNLNGKATLLLE